MDLQRESTLQLNFKLEPIHLQEFIHAHLSSSQSLGAIFYL